MRGLKMENETWWISYVIRLTEHTEGRGEFDLHTRHIYVRTRFILYVMFESRQTKRISFSLKIKNLDIG